MERHVKSQTVAREVGSERIRGAPANVPTGIGCGERDRALRQANDDKERGRLDDAILRASCLGCVDKIANDLWVE
jgi:hypothetical protein